MLFCTLLTIVKLCVLHADRTLVPPTITEIIVNTFEGEVPLRTSLDYYQFINNQDLSGDTNYLKCKAVNSSGLTWQHKVKFTDRFTDVLPAPWVVEDITLIGENEYAELKIHLRNLSYDLGQYSVSKVVDGFYRCVATSQGGKTVALSPSVRLVSLGLEGDNVQLSSGSKVFRENEAGRFVCDQSSQIRPSDITNSFQRLINGRSVVTYSWSYLNPPPNLRFQLTSRIKMDPLTGDLYYSFVERADETPINVGLYCIATLGLLQFDFSPYFIQVLNNSVPPQDLVLQRPERHDLDSAGRKMLEQIECVESLPCHVVCIFGGKIFQLDRRIRGRNKRDNSLVFSNSTTGFVYVPKESQEVHLWDCELYTQDDILYSIEVTVKVRNLPKIEDNSSSLLVKVVPEHGWAELTCAVRNVDVSNITIYYNGSKVTEDYPTFAEFDSVGSRLIFRNMTQNYTASIMCEAVNEAGSIYLTTNLIVRECQDGSRSNGTHCVRCSQICWQRCLVHDIESSRDREVNFPRGCRRIGGHLILNYDDIPLDHDDLQQSLSTIEEITGSLIVRSKVGLDSSFLSTLAVLKNLKRVLGRGLWRNSRLCAGSFTGHCNREHALVLDLPNLRRLELENLMEVGGSFSIRLPNLCLTTQLSLEQTLRSASNENNILEPQVIARCYSGLPIQHLLYQPSTEMCDHEEDWRFDDKGERDFVRLHLSKLQRWRDVSIWLRDGGERYLMPLTLQGEILHTSGPTGDSKRGYFLCRTNLATEADIAPVKTTVTEECDGRRRYVMNRTICTHAYGQDCQGRFCTCVEESEQSNEVTPCCLKDDIHSNLLVTDDVNYAGGTESQFECAYDNTISVQGQCSSSGQWKFNQIHGLLITMHGDKELYNGCPRGPDCSLGPPIEGTNLFIPVYYLSNNTKSVPRGEAVFHQCLDGYERPTYPDVIPSLCDYSNNLQHTSGISLQCHPKVSFDWLMNTTFSDGLCVAVNSEFSSHQGAIQSCLDNNATLLNLNQSNDQLINYIIQETIRDSQITTLWIAAGSGRVSVNATCLTIEYSSVNNTYERRDTSCDGRYQSLCGSGHHKLDGGWGQWLDWTACGIKTRTRWRSCDNPAPFCGGELCVGVSEETGLCCEDPGHPTSSTRKYNGRLPGESIEYHCLEGFKTADGANESFIVCEETGYWSADPPSCMRVPCEQLAEGKFSSYYIPPWLEGQQLLYEDYVEYVCDDGFVVSGTQVEIKRRATCSREGVWRPRTVDCWPRRCPEILIENSLYVNKVRSMYNRGEVEGGYYYSDKVEVKCMDGYRFLDQRVSVSITCTDAGQWSQSLSHCVEIHCAKLPPLSDTIVSYPNVSIFVKKGEDQLVDCLDGYETSSGSLYQNLTCVEGSIWNPLQPQPCSKVNCSDPGDGVNVVERDGVNFRFGSEVTYLCAVGYITQDTKTTSRKIVCRTDRSWSMPAPVCVPVQCEPPLLGNGTEDRILEKSYNYSAELGVNCLPTFHVYGHRDLTHFSLTCQENEEWESDSPQLCVKDTTYVNFNLTVSTEKVGVVHVTFIQSRAYQGIKVNYTLTMSGYSEYTRELTNYSVNFIVNTSGLHTRSLRLTPGFDYILEASLLEGTNRRISTTDKIRVPSGAPSLDPSFSLLDVRPQLIAWSENVTLDIKVTSSSFDVAVRQLFTQGNGNIVGFTLIVCEVNPFLDQRFYDGQLERYLPGYNQVKDITGAAIWPPYQAFPPSDFFHSVTPADGKVKVMSYRNAGADAASNSSENFSSTENKNFRVPMIKPKPLSKQTADLSSRGAAIIRIGDGSCETETPGGLCNGLLRSHRVYCVKLRAFTEDNFLDSPCSVPVLTAGTGGLTYTVVAPLLLSLLPFCTLGVMVMFLVPSCFRKVEFSSQEENSNLPKIVRGKGGYFLLLGNTVTPCRTKQRMSVIGQSITFDEDVLEVFGHEVFYNQEYPSLAATAANGWRPSLDNKMSKTWGSLSTTIRMARDRILSRLKGVSTSGSVRESKSSSEETEIKRRVLQENTNPYLIPIDSNPSVVRSDIKVGRFSSGHTPPVGANVQISQRSNTSISQSHMELKASSDLIQSTSLTSIIEPANITNEKSRLTVESSWNRNHLTKSGTRISSANSKLWDSHYMDSKRLASQRSLSKGASQRSMKKGASQRSMKKGASQRSMNAKHVAGTKTSSSTSSTVNRGSKPMLPSRWSEERYTVLGMLAIPSPDKQQVLEGDAIAGNAKPTPAATIPGAVISEAVISEPMITGSMATGSMATGSIVTGSIVTGSIVTSTVRRLKYKVNSKSLMQPIFE